VTVNGLTQCFSTFLLQRNFPQMFVLLMESPCNCETVVLLQPHRTGCDVRPRQFRSVSAELLAASGGTRDAAGPWLKNTGLTIVLTKYEEKWLCRV